ncbi:hypothetical protein ACP4TB_24675 [Streptomyces sp. DR3-1]|uniref:hypothetical protein n=1 Tax=Streptomyces sp. DR3-1 TaxID=2951169 RepID=UPI0020430690|nr:hypothetical protein [Streptomyces sp. DR3-1]MCM3821472.1 hypothetical protein [Streptomyces sp. DR3-1]
MSTPVELLAVASGAVAGTMGTDLYGYTRQRIVGLWRRGQGEGAEGEAEVLTRLDTLEQAVAALEPEQRAAMATGVQVPVREILVTCVSDDQPEALQELIDALKARGAEVPVVAHQTVTGNFALGNINTAGRDNNFGGTR